jgi:Uma2 family endonuclease
MSRAILDPAVIERSVDQRVFLYGLSWQDLEALLVMRGDQPGVRLAYLDGTLELMTPSHDHEILKKTLARLLEAYAEELDIELEGYGSWTLKGKDEKRAIEPDECYSIGPTKTVPALAIEVVWTSGGLDKLEIYRRLGVREVWRWKDGRITVFELRDDAWVQTPRSGVLPQVDIALIESLLDTPTQTAAVRALRTHLRERREQ